MRCEYADTCDDGVSITDDHLTTVDECTTGTYEVTFTVVDASGNTNTCANFHEFDDCTPPECSPDSCNVDVEACTGEYTEMGATFTDTYDEDIQSKSTTTYTNPSGDVMSKIDPWVMGTWKVAYEAADQNGHTNSYCGIEVEVSDNTPPVMALMSDTDSVIFEASDRDSASDVGVGATCTDTCTAITARGFKAMGGRINGATSPSDTDLGNYISFTVAAWDYEHTMTYATADQIAQLEEYTSEYSDAAGDSNSWIQDEQQYYCGESLSSAEALAAGAEAVLPTGGAKGDELVLYLDMLADDCAMYEVTYSCADWVGLTASTTQYILTIDTTPPELFYMDCYDDASSEECDIYFKAYAMAKSSAIPAAGIALVALVAGVAFKTGRRSTYMPL